MLCNSLILNGGNWWRRWGSFPHTISQLDDSTELLVIQKFQNAVKADSEGIRVREKGREPHKPEVRNDAA